MAVFKLGAEYRVNSDPAHAGSNSSVATLADGTILFAWEGPALPFGPGSANSEIFGRLFRYDEAVAHAAAPDAAFGFAKTADILINSVVANQQLRPQVTGRCGSFVVSYDSADATDSRYFATTQLISSSGGKLGAERFSPAADDARRQTDNAVFANDSFVTVSSNLYRIEANVHRADGTIQSTFRFGGVLGPEPVGITSIDDSRFLAVWSGYASPIISQPVQPYGLWVQVGTASGAQGAPVRIADLPINYAGDEDPVARLMPDGDVVIVWNEGLSGFVYGAIFDPVSGVVETPAFQISPFSAGRQRAADVAVLDDGRFVVVWQDGLSLSPDTSPPAIRGILMDDDGTPDSNFFTVNSITAGTQYAPSVAALGQDFVVSWSGPTGVQAQFMQADFFLFPSGSYLFFRPGTQHGIESIDQALTGPVGANTFYLDVEAPTDDDVITNFETVDLLLATKPFSSDGAKITLGEDGSLPFDAYDTLKLPGVLALRSIGTPDDNLFGYADASVRPQDVNESGLGRDTFSGVNNQVDTFFFDTALAVSLGNDGISRFGPGDRIVTTTAIYDANNDGRVGADRSDRFLLGAESISDPTATILKVYNQNGKAVSNLSLIDVVEHTGLSYYVYAQNGDATAMGDLIF